MITSTSNELIVELCKLHDKKYRDNKKQFLVQTPKLIKEALNEGYLPSLFLCTQEYKNTNKIEFSHEIVSENVLKKLCESVTPQGCVAVFDYLEEKSALKGNFIVLDRIQDPANVGAIIRSALGANFIDVYLIDCADCYDNKVLRSSMGAVFHVNLHKVAELQLVERLRSENQSLICCDMIGENVFKCEFDARCGFVVGNEGRGVSENLKAFASKKVSIPMNSKLESLNAAVSASIVMYQVFSKNS